MLNSLSCDLFVEPCVSLLLYSCIGSLCMCLQGISQTKLKAFSLGRTNPLKKANPFLKKKEEREAKKKVSVHLLSPAGVPCYQLLVSSEEHTHTHTHTHRIAEICGQFAMVVVINWVSAPLLCAVVKNIVGYTHTCST